MKGMSKQCLNSEMTVMRNVVVQNIGFDVDSNLKNVIKVLLENKPKSPNLYKLFKISLTTPISLIYLWLKFLCCEENIHLVQNVDASE